MHPSSQNPVQAPPEIINLDRGVRIVINTPDERFPLGRRGERPIRFTLPQSCKGEIKDLKWQGIPGLIVDASSCTVDCTFDVVLIVASYLSINTTLVSNIITSHATTDFPMPGKSCYLKLGLDKILRPYQKEAATFLCRRAYGWNALPMGGGKTVATLAAATLLDAHKILVVPPAFVTREWSKQIAQYLGEESVVLQGRACREARILCMNCRGKGFVLEPESSEDSPTKPAPCPCCPRRTPGQRLLYVNDLRPVYDEQTTSEGHAYARYPATTWSCPKHRLIIEAKSGLCPACQDDMHDMIATHRWIIVNPELLMAHKVSDGVGGEYYRTDLRGWANVLAKHHFDIAMVDEAHQFRNYQLRSLDSTERSGETRRDRLKEVLRHVDRVWGVTGTPLFGFTRDYWSQLDIMSGGLWSDSWCEGLPFSYAKRYCNPTRDEVYGGYNWDGRSEHALSELEPRLRLLKFAKPRSEILAYMPRKTREVIEIDSANAEAKPIKISKKDKKTKAGRESALVRMMTRAGDVVRPILIDKAMSAICDGTGNKVIVFAKYHDSVDRLAKALDKAITSREYRRRCEQIGATIWACHGGQNKNIRLKAGEAFQEHDGAAIFVASIDSFQVGVRLHSLAENHPVTSVHFAEYHSSPLAMAQAEDRPFLPGVGGLTVYYYWARGTIHDRVFAHLIPRIEDADVLAHDETAAEMYAAMVKKESETQDEIFARLTADIDELDRGPPDKVDDDTDDETGLDETNSDTGTVSLTEI